MATTQSKNTRSTKATSPKATKSTNKNSSKSTSKNGSKSTTKNKNGNGGIKVNGVLFANETIRTTAAQFSTACNIEPAIEHETMKPRAIIAELAENIEALTTSEEARKIKTACRALLAAIYADPKHKTENIPDAVCKVLAGKVAKEKKAARPPRRTVNRTSFTIAALAALPKGKAVEHDAVIKSAGDAYTATHGRDIKFAFRQQRGRCLECIQILEHVGYVTVDGNTVTRVKDF